MDNLIEFLYSKFLQSDGISTDTRTLQPGNLFFALKGPHFNGNTLAAQALKQGATFAVVDEQEYATDPRMILVPDGLRALQDLATFHRSRFKRKLLAITGSNGKTTTKELVALVLAKKYIVHYTKGNLNNHIGVPLTLLDIHPQVEVAIIEMGANHVGEIAGLCAIANPGYGLITNIGEAHTETFGGIEGVLRGKSELFDHLRKTGGLPFVNQMDERLAGMTKRFEESVAYPSVDVELLRADPFLHIRVGGNSATTQLVGKYNFPNIAAAVAIGREFGVPDEAILEAVCSYLPENQRSQVIARGSVTIISDCYNANPTSMQAAIESLAEMGGRKGVVLGDMKEVENSAEKHAAIGHLLSGLKLEQVWLVGDHMQHAAAVLGVSAAWYPNVEALNVALQGQSFQDITILVKASRSTRLDKAIDWIKSKD